MVTGLKRVRSGGVPLGPLPVGQWRYLRPRREVLNVAPARDRPRRLRERCATSPPSATGTSSTRPRTSRWRCRWRPPSCSRSSSGSPRRKAASSRPKRRPRRARRSPTCCSTSSASRDQLGIDPIAAASAKMAAEREEVPGRQGARQQQEVHRALAWRERRVARVERGRRGAQRALALGARRAAAHADRDRRRPHDRRRGLRPRLPGRRRCCGAATSRTRARCSRRSASRVDRPPRKAEAAREPRRRRRCGTPPWPTPSTCDRQARAQRARTLGMLLVPLEADYAIALRRAPDLRAGVRGGLRPGAASLPSSSLRELLGVVGAHEWRRKGIEHCRPSGGRIHPHYGVFAPVRSEYVDLVAHGAAAGAPRPTRVAFDIGTGTGVLAAVLARRGIAARRRHRHGSARARLRAREHRAPRPRGDGSRCVRGRPLSRKDARALVVCNPPWVPARPSSPLEHGIYDPESRMLRGFLAGLAAHLAARRRGLAHPVRPRRAPGPAHARRRCSAWIEAAGLAGARTASTRGPSIRRPPTRSDPLHRGAHGGGDVALAAGCCQRLAVPPSRVVPRPGRTTQAPRPSSPRTAHRARRCRRADRP